MATGKKTRAPRSSSRPSKDRASGGRTGKDAQPAGGRARPGPREEPGTAGSAAVDENEYKDLIIVGLGASAGGLESFQRFFEEVPNDSRISFVVVQHMDPKGGLLPDLIRKKARIPVVSARDGIPVEPGKIYVTPPSVNPSLEGGRLRLEPYATQRGIHLPIDVFFRSLAQEMKGRAIGVILSGTGSDGTQGAKAIKAEGGIVFAQDEKSAKFPGMPQSASRMGCVDFVLPPERISGELNGILDHPLADSLRKEEPDRPVEGEEDVDGIFSQLKSATGTDFSFYKEATVRRRLLRRMVMRGIRTFREYERFLQENPEELEELSRDFMINVTSFFRDPEAFETLKKTAIADLLRSRGSGTVRIWIPGCSTGEEAYSLAICFLEASSSQGSKATLQIFATDIDEPALEDARAGIYPENIAQDVSPERLERFFAKAEGKYRIDSGIREMCVFARQDLTQDPPFSRIDLVSCRNVLIYMKPVLQKRVVSMFHYALMPQGVLFLGAAESAELTRLFDPVDRKHKIFIKKPGAPSPAVRPGILGTNENEPAFGKTAAASSPDRFQREANRILLSRYAPPGVLVNERMEILQFWGRTDPYLVPAPGPASFDVLGMAREGLAGPLRKLIEKARKEERPARADGVRIRGGGKRESISLEVIPLRLPGSMVPQFLVLFPEKPSAENSDGKPKWDPQPVTEERYDELERQIRETREDLELTIEEYRTANEELRSANEEVLSANEELQSTNEELETAKEELQSTNEELLTVNEELTNRNEELSQLSNDLQNFAASTDIPIVMVNAEHRIRRFTPRAGGLFNLINSDIDRPIGNIRPNVSISDLEGKIRDVGRTLKVFTEEVRDEAGRWLRMVIRPYRTLDDRIDGATILFLDIDQAKRAASDAENAHRDALAIVDTVREPLLVLDEDLRVLSANRSFCAAFQTSPKETVGVLVYRLGNGQWNIPALRRLLEEVLPQNSSFEDFEVEHDFPDLGVKKMVLNGRRVEGREAQPDMILLSIEDVTPKR